MAGRIRLFEKDTHGLLHEVPPAAADAARAGRRCSHVVLGVDVLWTAEEEAARDAEEAEARREQEEAAARERAEREREEAEARERAEQERAEFLARAEQEFGGEALPRFMDEKP